MADLRPFRVYPGRFVPPISDLDLGTLHYIAEKDSDDATKYALDFLREILLSRTSLPPKSARNAQRKAWDDVRDGN